MQYSLEKLKIEFEKEVWFIIDGTIDEKRKSFWLNQINEHKELKLIYDEILSVTDFYSEEEYDISNDKLIKILSLTKSPSSRKRKIVEILKNLLSSEDESNQLKVMIGGALASLALIFTLLSPNNIIDSTTEKEIFTWEGTEITDVINSIRDNNSTEENEIAKKYIMDQIKKDEWKSSVFTIASRIDELEKEIKNSSL